MVVAFGPLYRAAPRQHSHYLPIEPMDPHGVLGSLSPGPRLAVFSALQGQHKVTESPLKSGYLDFLCTLSGSVWRPSGSQGRLQVVVWHHWAPGIQVGCVQRIHRKPGVLGSRVGHKGAGRPSPRFLLPCGLCGHPPFRRSSHPSHRDPQALNQPGRVQSAA